MRQFTVVHILPVPYPPPLAFSFPVVGQRPVISISQCFGFSTLDWFTSFASTGRFREVSAICCHAISIPATIPVQASDTMHRLDFSLYIKRFLRGFLLAMSNMIIWILNWLLPEPVDLSLLDMGLVSCCNDYELSNYDHTKK